MVFRSFEFAFFFPVVIALSWALMPHPRAWKPFRALLPAAGRRDPSQPARRAGAAGGRPTSARAGAFIPQLAKPRDPRDVGAAVVLIALGLIKKVAIADYLAREVVDPYDRSSPTEQPLAEAAGAAQAQRRRRGRAARERTCPAT